MQTLLACWEENARGASGASLQRLPGVTAAVFPNEPERLVYNNAVLERGGDSGASATWAGSSGTRLSASRGNCMVRPPHRHYPHGHGPSFAVPVASRRVPRAA